MVGTPAYKKQQNSLVATLHASKDEAYRLIDTFADQRFGGIGIYTPIVRHTAPCLLKKEIQQKLLEMKVDSSVMQSLLIFVHFFTKCSTSPSESLQLLQMASATDLHHLKMEMLKECVHQLDADNILDFINMSAQATFENINDRTLLMECLFETVNWIKYETEISNILDDKIFAEFNEWVAKNQVPQMETEIDKELDTNGMMFDICAKLYEERDTTGDLTLNVGSESMKIHKLVVARRCDYFKTILTSNFRENSSSK